MKGLVRVIAETLGLFAGGYLLLMGGMAVFQRDMIYHPGSERMEPSQAGLPEMVAVQVRTEDGHIGTSWYAPPKERHLPTIVFFHGNAGTLAHRAHKARALLDRGYGVLLVGYRGYGGNPGRPTEDGLYNDARAALAWLIRKGIDANRIVLYGESLGTGVAVQMAGEFPGLCAVVLESPFTRLPDLAPAYVLPPVAQALMIDRFDNRAKIPHVTAPLLILHGEHDGLVPVAMGRELLRAARAEKEGAFLPNAAHNDIWEHGGAEAVLDFLARQVRF